MATVHVHHGVLEMGEHAFLGINVVVHPDVSIGEGAVVGSGAVVTKDLEPWTIIVGVPARPVRDRPRETLLRDADQLRSRHGG